jgi:hypothetical protein
MSAGMSVAQNATLTRTSPTVFTVCSVSPNVTLTYSLVGGIPGAQFGLLLTTTTAAVVCTATPSNASELCSG